MVKKTDELLKKLLVTFRLEADEHLRAMSSGLVALEETPAGKQRIDIIETIFRDAHSLKGAARAVDLVPIEKICQSLESVFASVKAGRLDMAPQLFKLLYETIDTLGSLLAEDVTVTSARQPLVATLIRRLDSAWKGLPADDAEPADPAESIPVYPPPVATDLAAETVRVSTAKLDRLMRQVEELLVPRLAAEQRTRDLGETVSTLVDWKKRRLRMQPTMRLIERSLVAVGQGTLQTGERGCKISEEELQKLLEYLESEQLNMKVLEDRLLHLNRAAEHDQRMLVGMTESLLHDVKEMQLMPFASMLEVLPRFARDMAREQDKDIRLDIRGGEIEIDRRVLEMMKDPLIHLLRNSIDHGIEKQAVRKARRKPAQGTITLAISQKDSGNIEVLVADDGAGIDAMRVKETAIKLGVAPAEEAELYDDARALALIFQSGLSTSQIITDVSGRGLGLAIVREKVERVGGVIAVESRAEAGTTFRIVLPLTLANFRGVLVRAGEQQFVIPAAHVERVARVASRDIQTVENRETIALDGEAVALAWLNDALELPRPRMPAQPVEDVPVVILSIGRTRLAFRVDDILGEQEVLVKSLGRQLVRVRNVAGASVLGTGEVVPVLNVPDLLKSAVKRPSTASVADHSSSDDQADAEGKQSILVVEDSITSRGLLKNILESSGYSVTTAVDGIDGFTALKTGAFDLIVSDVEMPRMDGFDLTAKVRADKKFGELPVVLVTALESREHRERGIDVGANAYIVKSSFDQSNLLDVIRRLI